MAALGNSSLGCRMQAICAELGNHRSWSLEEVMKDTSLEAVSSWPTMRHWGLPSQFMPRAVVVVKVVAARVRRVASCIA